jgi:hypothetical protein
MKKIIFFLMALFTVTIVYAQETTRIRVLVMKPKTDMAMEFSKGLAAHMAKYHTLANDPVNIYQVMSGSHTGEYHYVQPLKNWADLESKQYPADHAEDWNKNVGKFLVSEETHFLNLNETYSYNVNRGQSDWLIVSFITLKPGTYGTYLSMMQSRKEALEKAKDSRNFQVFNHSFSGRNNEFDFVYVTDLLGGIKDLDTDGTPLAKVMNDQLHPYAQQEWARNSDIAIKKIETMLVKRMPNLSSK